MDETKKSFRIPKSSIRFLLICLGVVILFIVAGLFPMGYAVSSLDKKEQALKLKVEEQEQLGPIYKTLEKQLAEKKVPTTLPLPARTRLSKEQVDQVPVTIRGTRRPRRTIRRRIRQIHRQSPHPGSRPPYTRRWSRG